MRKIPKRFWFMTLGACLAALMMGGSGYSSNLVTQTWLPGDCIPQFVSPLAVFGPGYNAALPRVNAASHPFLTVSMLETEQAVLPPLSAGYNATYWDPMGRVTANCPAVNVQPTRVWAYETRDSFTNKVLGPAHWPSVTLEAKRNRPNVVTYANKLPTWDPANKDTAAIGAGGLVQGLVTVDQTIDWADPLGNQAAHNCGTWPPTVPLDPACLAAYAGPLAPAPMITHLHGGEVPSQFDGGPLGWFTATGLQGMNYNTFFNAGPDKQVDLYQNAQEAGTLWIHDHVMGQTRTNVYSGPAAFYFIRDALREPANLPKGAYEIEIALQDRQFDTNSQLFWPDGTAPCGTGAPGVAGDPCLNGPPPNPGIHPFWIPEFLGDTATINGVPWPYLNVEPRRYRLHLLGGANARAWRLHFGSVPVYVIGSDDNYLDAPVASTVSAFGTIPGGTNMVFLAPGERADVIVDFTNFKGETITITNDAPAPFPMGLVPGLDQPGMANIIQFRVNIPLVGIDKSCDPASLAKVAAGGKGCIYGSCKRPYPMVRLADGKGNIKPGVVIDKKRQLILKEVASPTGPVMVTVNNTLYMGNNSPGVAALGIPDGMTETPVVGSTELWEIINLTPDAHPMHTHLVQFQVLNRESFQNGPPDAMNYTADWAKAFPAYAPWTFSFTWIDPSGAFVGGCTGGVFCPGYGPPLVYDVPNADGALGGNPAVGPYLKADATAPDPWESGWKDTAKAYPGQVLRMLVRWAPTDQKIIPNKSLAGHNFFDFDPTRGPGYVWHCHIVDHEDNDMMRPYRVTKGPYKPHPWWW